MNRKFLVFIFCFTTFLSFSQNQTGWSFEPSLGYAQKYISKSSASTWVVDEFHKEGDSIVDFTRTDLQHGFGSGVFLEADFKFQKESGWYYILGLQYQQGFPKEYWHCNFCKGENAELIDDLYLTEERASFLSSRIGLGYSTLRKRKINFYVEAVFLFGTAIWGQKDTYEGYGNYYDEENQIIVEIDKYITEAKSPLFGGFGLGLNAEAGGLIPLTNQMDLKLGFGLTMYQFKNTRIKYKEEWFKDGVLLNSEEQTFNFKEYNTYINRNSNFSDYFTSINFTAGVAFKL